MAYFKNTLDTLMGIADRTSAIAPVSQAAASSSASSGSMTPEDIAAALAEALKHDDSVTQAIAVRIANLSAKYPNRAY